MSELTPSHTNFIQDIVDEYKKNPNHKQIHTRFPPEPNGYLHIGHAKAISLDFGIALRNNGICNLRFDDTNPSKEEVEYVESIQNDIKWLGFDWEDRLYYASDYFEVLYNYAEKLIELGKAYVCDLSAEEIRMHRGTLTEPGMESPYRNRTVEENLELFRNMRAGKYADGSRVLRAKIDMASPNLNMRDPVIYRILTSTHHRTGDDWCIYPMYDYAHPMSDALEGITHSLCTLEFEDHRPLYEWFLNELNFIDPPRQIEFARLNITFTVMSKRKLLKLVKDGYVNGWDDPRMPTLSGMRRRGYPPAAIRDFCDRIGVAKTHSLVDFSLLEFCIREDLNKNAARAMAVLRPLKVVLDNYSENLEEEFDSENNPENPDAGSRKVPFSKVLYIEQDDFSENPPKGYFRLSSGKEVRLKNAYIIKCEQVIKDSSGNVTELHCTYDPESRGGSAPDGRKVRGTIHWVSAKHAKTAEVRLYEHLFSKETPDEVEEGGDYLDNLNENSVEIIYDAKIEPSLVESSPGTSYQFLRLGYFCKDPDSTAEKPVFNRTVTLRDTWAKISK